MSKMQRTKGKVWEREVAGMLREIFGDRVKRGWQAREGCDAPDIEGVPRQWPECKHHQRVNIAAAMLQAVEESTRAHDRMRSTTARESDFWSPYPWPVVYSKSNREEPLATMRLKDFLALLREWKALSDTVNFKLADSRAASEALLSVPRVGRRKRAAP